MRIVLGEMGQFMTEVGGLGDEKLHKTENRVRGWTSGSATDFLAHALGHMRGSFLASRLCNAVDG